MYLCKIKVSSLLSIALGMIGLVAGNAQAGDLLLADNSAGKIFRFDAVTGEAKGAFNTDGVIDPYDLVYGPDANGDGRADLYVTCNSDVRRVSRYDGASGKYIDDFAMLGVELATGIAIDSEHRNVFVNLNQSHQIARIDARNGTSTRGKDQSIANSMDITVGPDGNLYVADSGDGMIARYDAKTLEPLAAPGATGSPRFTSGSKGDFTSVIFGPDANGDGKPDLYAADQAGGRIARFDGASGVYIDDLVSGEKKNGGDLTQAYSLRMGPDANGDGKEDLYVVGVLGSGRGVAIFDVPTAKPIKSLIKGDANLKYPTFLTFMPDAGAPLTSLPPDGEVKQDGDTTLLTFSHPQTAGISGFRSMWDQATVLSEDGAAETVDQGQFGKASSAIWSSKRPGGRRTGALAFDAAHRSLLVRFPAAAEQIAKQLRLGNHIEKAELVLPLMDVELWPELYELPSGLSFLGDTWAKEPPTWHAIAYELRKPWMADGDIGPTFNASIKGAANWATFGAQDEKQDRYPTQFGPAEVSQTHPEGRLDITAALTGEEHGRTMAERLRAVADQGFLVRKWEVYDARYHKTGYEWGTATGGRGILIRTPQFVITFKKGAAPDVGDLPAPADVAAIAEQMKKDGTGGAPTAVMPSAEQIKEMAAKYGFNRPASMPDWEWQRIQELNKAGGSWTFPETPEAYAKWIDGMLAIMPRRWDGFDAADKVQSYKLYHQTWPKPVEAYVQLYWWAWLMPDRATDTFVHPQSQKVIEYYKDTGDWRGNTSFYRDGYCYAMSTMNFNHTAATGALLGGSIINEPLPMADGRHGLEAWPLRTWCWFDGSTQESLDHYYFSLSLKDQKMFADFGPTHLDRMMGRSILAKSVDELAGSYHPGLRRFISSSGRTGLAYIFVTQDGTKHIVHTLSHSGAETDLDNKEIYGGMDPIGHDAKPGMIAQQTLNGPWAPDWFAYTVDEKPLPYEMVRSYKMWGHYNDTPLWRVNYLGVNYGMASQDVAAQNESIPVMAQWRRAEKAVEKMDEIGTLTVRFGINQTNLLDTLHPVYKDDKIVNQNPNGVLGLQGGYTATFQNKNRMLVFTSPTQGLKYGGGNVPEEVHSLQTTIGLFDFEKNPSWELYVDEQRVSAYPVKVKAGQRITIKDGVSFVGIIPLPSTDLGRSDEVIITDQTGELVGMQGGGKAKPTLIIEQYNYKSTENMPQARRDSDEVNLAYGGYAIEVDDAKEYVDFAAFQQHLKEAKLDAKWNAEEKVLDVSYKSGQDLMECGYKPDYSSDWDKMVPTDQCFPYRKLNGQWPYLAKGIERDSSLTLQATTGRLEKNGATLTCEPGKMAYLQTEPVTGTFAAFNPFPDPVSDWTFTVPGGASIRGDGKLALTRVTARPSENKLWIDYATQPGANAEGMAKNLIVTGPDQPPQVEYNGKPLEAAPQATTIDGHKAFLIPLSGEK